MRLWKVVVLVNLALTLGIGLGYLRWAQEVRALQEELDRAREEARRGLPGARSWTVSGIVRAVLASQEGLFLTHETIPGLMPAMTMGFPVERPELLRGLGPGDPVRFTLREEGARVVIVAIERAPAP